MNFLLDSSFGLLGMNRRNAEYILEHNPRRQYPLVDDKLRTKRMLEEHGLPVAETYLEITHPFQIPRLKTLQHMREFVIKPVRGAEGRGILVLTGREGDNWRKASGELLKQEDLDYHVTNILAGLYSLGGTDDACFAEYFIHSHPVFNSVSFRGVPDIRVVLYRGVPVMAMLRLPTRQSDGKANLHQGAIGVGVDLETGVTTNAVHKNHFIQSHPDTHQPVSGIRIPFWNKILETAAGAFDIFHLGYIGVDFVIDILLGPLILEVNARPGLNIQLANQRGLLPRLRKVDQQGKEVESWTPQQRRDFARNLAHL